jgi:hypothetical protein
MKLENVQDKNQSYFFFITLSAFVTWIEKLIICYRHQKARDKESYDAKRVGRRVDSIRDKLTDKEQKLMPLQLKPDTDLLTFSLGLPKNIKKTLLRRRRLRQIMPD